MDSVRNGGAGSFSSKVSLCYVNFLWQNRDKWEGFNRKKGGLIVWVAGCEGEKDGECGAMTGMALDGYIAIAGLYNF